MCPLVDHQNLRFYYGSTTEFEVRLTSILQVYIVKDNEPAAYCTPVANDINANSYQHYFTLCINAMGDGLRNSVLEGDVVPAPSPLMSMNNPSGKAIFSRGAEGEITPSLKTGAS